MSLSLPSALALLPLNFIGVVVGGTAGIGHGIAKQLATSPSARVIISGRNATAAEKICKDAPNGNIEFRRLDASLMKNCRDYCDELKKELGDKKIDFLALSAGILGLGRNPTAEGIDTLFALAYYSRFFIAKRLIELDVLSPTAIVMTIYNPVVGDPSGKSLIWNDLDLSSGSYGMLSIFTGYLWKVIKHVFSITDIMIQDIAIQTNDPSFHTSASTTSTSTSSPRRTFIHASPGFVETEIFQISNLPWFLKKLVKTTSPKGVTIEFSGEKMVIGGVECRQKTLEQEGGGGEGSAVGKKTYYYMDDKGMEFEKVVTEEDVRLKIREHTWTLIDDAMNGGVAEAKGKGSLPVEK